MRSLIFLSLIGLMAAGTTPGEALGRRDVGTLQPGTQAFVICHGNPTGREGQQYVTRDPVPITIEATMDPAARDTFNGTSDTPEPRLSNQFKAYLEARLGSPAVGECHLSDSASAAQAMIAFWQQADTPGASSNAQTITWSPTPLIAAPAPSAQAKATTASIK